MGRANSAAVLPLAGTRVLDLSRLVAGNQLTQQLADFGCDVIKVERPGQGDPLREWRVQGVDVWWQAYGRNKRSITIDLKQGAGRDLLLDLLSDCRVVVESFRPGGLERLGLGFDELRARRPDVVLVRVSGWGQTGNYASRPGFGTLVEAMSGFAAMNGFPDREPVLPPLPLADMVAGLYGAFGTVVALQSAQVTGRGQIVDVALLESLVSVLGPIAAAYELTGLEPTRSGSRSRTSAPRNVYRTKDGKWLAISGSMQSMAARIFKVVGRVELLRDSRFCSNTKRLQNVEELDRIVGGYVANRTLEENMEEFVVGGVTAAPVYDVRDLVANAHVVSREVFVEAGSEGLPIHNVVPRLSSSPGEILKPAPRLGEHVEDVLTEFGLSREVIGSLRNDGVV